MVSIAFMQKYFSDLKVEHENKPLELRGLTLSILGVYSHVQPGGYCIERPQPPSPPPPHFIYFGHWAYASLQLVYMFFFNIDIPSLSGKKHVKSLQNQNFLTLQPPNYSIWIFTHLKLCLADAIHNFKWVKIIQIWQNRSRLFSNLAGWCHILSLTYIKCGT